MVSQFQQIGGLLCQIALRHKRGHQAAGAFPEYAGRFTVLIPLDLSARRIRRVPVDAGQSERRAVDAADVGAGPHDRDRRVAAAPIQVVPVRRALFQQALLIVAPSQYPLARFLDRPLSFYSLYQFFDGMDLRRHDGDLLPAVRQHDRVHMCVHKAGDHAPSPQICEFMLRHRLTVYFRHLFFPSDPGDPPVFNGHAVGIRMQPVGCEDLSVYKNHFSSLFHDIMYSFRNYDNRNCHICQRNNKNNLVISPEKWYD